MRKQIKLHEKLLIAFNRLEDLPETNELGKDQVKVKMISVPVNPSDINQIQGEIILVYIYIYLSIYINYRDLPTEASFPGCWR